jgi:hypothetical protein
MGESDARFAAVKLLDKRFFEYPHLNGKTNATGDYEAQCKKCGAIETYSVRGKLSASQRHIFMMNR